MNKVLIFLLLPAFCLGNLCKGYTKRSCCDPEGGATQYKIRSTYSKGCTEYVCAKRGKVYYWKERSRICPDILCPSLETSCVANDNSNIIKKYQGHIYSYDKCGEKCKQNEDCKYWTFNTTGTSIPICYLLENCFKSENKFNTISGNNLCPLPEPFPCPAYGFSCIESDEANVVDTIYVDNYKVCGARCMEHNYCQFWTISNLLLPFLNATCKLLSSCAPHRVATAPGFPLEVVKSGNRNCPSLIPLRSSCCSPGFFCLGLCTFLGCSGVCVPIPQSSAIQSKALSSSALQSKWGGCPQGCIFIMAHCYCPPPVRPPFCCPGCTGWCSGFGCMGQCPYEHTIQESCSSLALQAHEDSCKSNCIDISNDGCQSCVETSLPDSCQQPSGSSCWKCVKTVWDAVLECDFVSNLARKFKCIIDKLDGTQCSNCVCTLLCYFFPHSSLCSLCEGFPHLMVNYESCPGGGVLRDGYCFKAYAEGKSFNEALAHCASFDGELAEVNSQAKVYAVTEAIQNAQLTECWIGGRREQQYGYFLWENDGSEVYGDNWAIGFPTDHYPSCMTQSAEDSEWRNYDCEQTRCSVCQYEEPTSNQECDVTVISGDVYDNDDRFKVAHVLTRSIKEEWGKNYWALPDKSPGEFILNLGCEKAYNEVELVNTINGENRDRGTNRFKVFLSLNENGPWLEVIDQSLADGRNQENPLPLQKFNFNSVNARYVKFYVISWYGWGGGLQYFNVKSS